MSIYYFLATQTFYSFSVYTTWGNREEADSMSRKFYYMYIISFGSFDNTNSLNLFAKIILALIPN